MQRVEQYALHETHKTHGDKAFCKVLGPCRKMTVSYRSDLQFVPDRFISHEAIVWIHENIDDWIGDETEDECQQNHEEDSKECRRDPTRQPALNLESLKVELMSTFVAFPH